MMIKEYKSSFFLKMLCSIVKKTGSFNVPIVERAKLEPVPFKYKGLIKNKIANLDVYSKHSKTNDMFIYLHGGAYLLGIDNYNVSFIKDLQRKTKATVHMIDYPLAPKHKVNQVIKETLQTIKEIQSNNLDKRIHLIGDSAGAGLCLALLKKINHINNVILLSPWLDVSMTNKEIDLYKDLDVVLDKEDLIECGKLYSDNHPKSIEASPIYDDFKAYDNLTIFVGTNDMLYPDVIEFNKLNPKTNLHIYHEAPHGFMIFPMTKEKKQVINLINDILSND